MSLMRAVIRATAVGALRDRTWAETRVYDSDMTPLAEAVYGQKDIHGNPVAKPYIVVYTDTDDISPVTGVNEIYNSENRSLSLVLEIGVASAVRDPSGTIKIHFSATDTGMEWACDIISAQSLAALIGDPYSPWGDLFKRFCSLRRMPTRRGGMAQQGVRFAARKITLVMKPLWDLVPGDMLEDGHPILDFINLAKTNPVIDQLDVAALVQAFLPTAQIPSWRVAQGLLGLDTKAVRILQPEGTPLPYDDYPLEQPPFDPMDNEFAPMLKVVTLDDTHWEDRPIDLEALSISVDPPTIGFPWQSSP